MSDMTLQVRITADGAELIGVTREATKEIDRLTGTEKQAGQGGREGGRGVSEFSKKLEESGGMAQRMTRSLVAMAASYFTLRSAVNMVAEFRAQEIATVKLDTIINSMGRSTEGLSQRLQALAAQIQGEGIIGDDAIIEGQALLAVYGNITDDMLPRATQAMVDLAAFMGKDVTSAARALGMASEGSAQMLQRMGIVIDEDVLKSGDFARILEAIIAKLGPVNRNLGEGAGEWTKLGTRIGEVSEAIGGLIGTSPALIAWGNDAVTVVEHLADRFRDLWLQITGAKNAAAQMEIDEMDQREREILDKMAKNRAEFEDLIANNRLSRAVPSLFLPLVQPGYEAEQERLQEKLTKIRVARQLRMANERPALSGAGGSAGTGGDTQGAELLANFEAQSREMQKQVDLYGQTGLAAALRWERDHDGMKGYTPAQQAHLVGLAEILDSKEAIRRKTEEQTKAEEDYINEVMAFLDQGVEMERKAKEERDRTFATRFDQLQHSLRTELEAEEDRYQESLRLLDQAEAKKLDHLMGWAEMRSRLEQEHQENVQQIQQAIEDKAKDTSDKMSEFAIQAAHNMQNAFADLFFNAMNGEFDNLAGNFARTLQRMAAELAASEVLELLTGDMGKTGKMGGWIGSLVSGVSSFFGPASAGMSVPGDLVPSSFYHRGGVVGESSDQRRVPAGLFHGAPRLHAGGLAGDEVPAILRRGEEVLTRSDPRHRGNGATTVEKGGGLSIEIGAIYADDAIGVRRAVAEGVKQAVQIAEARTPGVVRGMMRARIA